MTESRLRPHAGINTEMSAHLSAAAIAHLAKRRRKEAMFRISSYASIVIVLAMLLTLLLNMGFTGWRAFQQGVVTFEITLDAAEIDPNGMRDPEDLAYAGYRRLVLQALYGQYDSPSRKERRIIRRIISSSADLHVRNLVVSDPSLLGHTHEFTFVLDDEYDQLLKGKVDLSLPEDERRISDEAARLFRVLQDKGLVRLRFNTDFFTLSDSLEPEEAGLFGSIVGSLFTVLVCLFVSTPLGIGAAIYLQEIAPKTRLTTFIEVNINNLAAAPSIIYGLLGLVIFLGVFGVPRSASLAGGLTLSLMTLPTVIIATRVALQAVPDGLRQAAWGLGASRQQTIFHHVLPLAMPGAMTGIILGMSRALGETAPLLMIGMVAFIADVPQGFTDPSSALPVQIFLWADHPERAFQERTAAATIVLLLFLIGMNGLAIYLRSKFDRRW